MGPGRENEWSDRELRVWLEDYYVGPTAPEGWIQVRTAHEAIDLLDTGRVVELGLDPDLGDDLIFGRGLDVVDWIAERQESEGRLLWPRDGITVHSEDRASREAMRRAIWADASRRLRVIEARTADGNPRFLFKPFGAG